MGFGPGSVREARDLFAFDEDRTARLSGELLVRGVNVTSRGTWYVSGFHNHQDIDMVVEVFGEALQAA
jgi:hypothetical protein